MTTSISSSAEVTAEFARTLEINSAEIHAYIHQLFEKQVSANPERTAIREGNSSFSYADLHSASNKYCRYFRDRGVTEGDIIAVSLNRSFGLIACFLGILKSGACYLPLNPDLPPQRVRFILNDCKPRLFIGASDVDSIPAGIAVVNIDEPTTRSDIDSHEGGNLSLQFTKTNSQLPAYAIYTSGTTGKPKGISVAHVTITNLIESQKREFPEFSQPLRTPVMTSIGFDVSVQEITTTLASGGELFIIPDDIRKDLSLLSEIISGKKIERIFLPYPVLQKLSLEFLSLGKNENINLKQIITAGEQLVMTPELVQWLSFIDCKLINQYGPSETHVITSYSSDIPYDEWDNLPPIGREIINTTIFILGENNVQVKDGTIGELCAGGAGLAIGYINNEELNERAFISLPAREGAVRLYKTGDLAYRNSDGDLVFCGRKDTQIKIRGYRVEPGEIESSLANIGIFNQLCVMAIEKPNGEKDLAAFAELNHDAVHSITGRESYDSADLISFIKDQANQFLPDYMIPNSYLFLDSLPINHNGKIDREKLAALQENHKPTSTAAPRHAIDSDLVALFEDLLAVSPIGIDDNFFESGGNSLLVVNITRFIREKYGVKYSAKDIFLEPTIRAISDRLDSLQIAIID